MLKQQLPFKILQGAASLTLFAGVLLICIPLILRRPILYEAQARMWIQSFGESQPMQRTEGVNVPSAAYFNSPIQTASEIIRSGEVIKRSVELLKSRHIPGGVPPADDMLHSISVEPIKDTAVVVVKYKAPNAEQSAQILQAVLDACIDISKSQNSESATAQRYFLQDQLVKANERLTKLSVDLAAYQKTHGISDLKDDARRLLDNLADAEVKLKEEESLISQKQQLIRSMESKLQNKPVSSVPVEQALEEKLSFVQMELLQAQGKFKENHPMRRRLEKERERLMANLASLRTNDGVEVQPLKEEIAREQLELVGLEQSRNDRLAALRQLDQRRAQLPVEAVAWSELERENETATNLVSELERQLHLARLQESVAQGMSNIKVIDSPTTPLYPLGPSKQLLMACGFVGASIMAALAHALMGRLNPFIVSPKEAQDILPLSVVGVFPLLNAPEPGHVDRIRRKIAKSLKNRKRILIASASKGDGKTTFAVELGKSFAQAGYPTCLIDINQCHPELHARFNLAPCPGLSEYSKDKDKTSILTPVRLDLSLVRCGVPDPNANLLEQRGLANFLSELEALFEVIIFDGTAAEASAQYLAALEAPTFIVVVARLYQTAKRSLCTLSNHLQDHEGCDAAYVFADAEEADLVRPEVVPHYKDATLEGQPVW